MQVFARRAMASGGAFHRACPHATQQAFLEAHEFAFAYFGGVFRRLRYDNPGSAVKKILRGYRREETTRFIAFRSHWQFDAEFCNPAEPQEKGGVEGEAGYLRRNHWVPIPEAANFDALNRQLLAACQSDQKRVIGERVRNVGSGMAIERDHLRPLPAEGFPLAEESFASVDGKGCVCVRTNAYSTPLAVGTRAHVRVLPAHIEIWHQGACVARHERCFGRRQQIPDLEHYLATLMHKPGALAGCRPLARWRAEGRWPPGYDALWSQLNERHGKADGTRLMIELLQAGQRVGNTRLTAAVETAVALNCKDAAAVHYLLNQVEPSWPGMPVLDVGALARYQRPLPDLSAYNLLLTQHG